MKIISWNVNGIRAVQKKGFVKWLHKEAPDILCVQETKADLDQLTEELTNISGYNSAFTSAEKKGYSGVAMFFKKRPVKLKEGIGVRKFDSEGRIQVAEFKDFILCNIYFPNGKASRERLKYKMDFYEAFSKFAKGLIAKGKNLVVCGDVNTAHKEIDLARPKENSKISGFLPEEREWIDGFLAKGFIDAFRMLNDGPENYTWWDYKTGARERNVGWRIDYFFVSRSLERKVKSAFILKDVYGSDHCPIGIELKSSS